MVKWWLAFAGRQSRDEVRRQYGAIGQKEAQIRLLALMPFAIAAFYISPWLCLVLMVLNAALDIAGVALMKELDPPRQPGRYLLTLTVFAASQVCYMLIPALVWQVPDDFARSFAVGFFLVNIVHLATIRSVHLPLVMTALAPATLITVVANTWLWVGAGDWLGLAISSLCLAALMYFVLITVMTIHQLHQQMFRDRQAAEAANEAKSRFLAQMSHELRTPLNAILGMGQAELMEPATALKNDRLATMVTSARNLSVLLDDILDLAAVQAGQLPIRPAVVDLRSETLSTLALFRQQVENAGLALALTISAEVPAHVRIDAQRLRQCLSNVLSNAVKYTRQGTITVDITLPDEGHLAIEVADTGTGISLAMAERLFEPFQRGDNPLPGTGLGLSISRTLARRMGGDLVLLPSAAGARFRLSFALVAADPQDLAAPQSADLVDLRGKRVLVVDDVGTNRLVAMTFLHRMGAATFEADSGLAALDLLAQGGIDLVLLDMLMPDMDGLTTFARIRSLQGAAGQVPVIAMTADASEDNRRQCRDAGLSGYATKPLSPEGLSLAIQEALRAMPG